MEDIQTIGMDGVKALLASDEAMELVDVRTPAEFREVHAPRAKSIPLDELDAEAYRRARGAERGPSRSRVRRDGA